MWSRLVYDLEVYLIYKIEENALKLDIATYQGIRFEHIHIKLIIWLESLLDSKM